MYTIIFCLASLWNIPDGSLLFIEGGNNTVMNACDSPYSHVAMIFNINGEPWVYESIAPVVRKTKLSDYIKEIEAENERDQKLMKLWVRKPKVKLDIKAMKKYAESQLGRSYGVGSYLSGKPRDSIHCGEFTARTLIAGDVKVYGNPCKKTPQGIMYLCRPYYRKPMML